MGRTLRLNRGAPGSPDTSHSQMKGAWCTAPEKNAACNCILACICRTKHQMVMSMHTLKFSRYFYGEVAAQYPKETSAFRSGPHEYSSDEKGVNIAMRGVLFSLVEYSVRQGVLAWLQWHLCFCTNCLYFCALSADEQIGSCITSPSNSASWLPRMLLSAGECFPPRKIRP